MSCFVDPSSLIGAALGNLALEHEARMRELVLAARSDASPDAQSEFEAQLLAARDAYLRAVDAELKLVGPLNACF